MRRFAPLLLGTLVLVGLRPSALAQEGLAIRLVLDRQTPWTTHDRPALSLSVRATNDADEAVGALSLQLTMFPAVRSRTAYETSLAADPALAPVLTSSETFEGRLEPGRTRPFRATVDTAPLLAQGESLVYPMKAELRSAGTPVAAIRTAAIVIVRRPRTPIALAWTFVLHHPTLMRADGSFSGTALERSVAPGGDVASVVRALAAVAEGTDAPPFDLALSPTLLLQLQQMRDGYSVSDRGTERVVRPGDPEGAAAQQMLDAFRTLGGAEIVSFPFGAPNVPALVASGLAQDLGPHLERGRSFVTPAVGPADPALFRPPGGVLDDAALELLAAQGVRVVVANRDTVIADQGTAVEGEGDLGFALPPTASLATRSGPVTAVVPNESVQALLESSLARQDPVLGAQAVLGELAVIWLEQPRVPRGVAVLFPEEEGPPSGLFGPLVRGIARAPWLKPITASELIDRFPPGDQQGALAVPPADTGAFSPTFVERLERARDRIQAYRSILVPSGPVPDPDPARLEALLLLAEGDRFLERERAGRSLIGSARAAIGRIFAGIGADPDQEFTLVSRHGVIPVQLHNATGRAVRIRVQLVSSRLARTPARQIRLEPGNTTLPLDVELQTAGTFTLFVLVSSPSNAPVSRTELTVRSTAYNRVALIVTIAAGVLLLVAWVRRLLPRTSR